MRQVSRKALQEKSSLASALSEMFITSRLTVAFILACLCFGFFAIIQTPRQDNPRIVVPAARISAELPGATPEEVEHLILEPMEAMLKQIPGVDEVQSSAMNSLALLYVTFKTGEDEDKMLVRLQDRISSRRDLLPTDASQPTIRGVKVDDVPILTLTLASAQYDDFALKRMATMLAHQLRTLENVSGVDVQGGRDREWRIELDPGRMQSFGITIDQVREMLSAGNVAAPMGNIVRQGLREEIYLDGFIPDSHALEQLVVGQYANRSISLGDIATIIDGPPEQRQQLSRLAFGPADARFRIFSGEQLPAVTVTVAKTADANATLVARQVLEKVHAWRQAQLPSNVEVVVTRNDGAFADQTVNGLLEHLVVAVLAVFLVITLFLGLRQALIVGLGIPLVLAITLGMVWLAGYSINRVTLFGLILALGLLVDDAIVVIENVHRHYLLATTHDRRQATLIATREIGNPTNLATLAVIIVFLSMMSVPGMTGQFFFPIAYTVPVAMGASLLVAYTVIPWAALRWLPSNDHGQHAADKNRIDEPGRNRHNAPVERLFRRCVAPLIDKSSHRRKAFFLVLVLLVLSLLQPAWQFIRSKGVNEPQSLLGVELGIMPSDNKNTFNIVIKLPQNRPIEDTDRVARAIGRVLISHSEVRDYQIWLGRGGIVDFNGLLRGNGDRIGENVAEIRVNLRNRSERKIVSSDIVRELRPLVQKAASIINDTEVQMVEDPPGAPVKGSLYAEIYSQDSKLLHATAAAVKREFSNTRDVVEVSDSETSAVGRYRFMVDREKASRSGVTAAEVARALRRLIDGETLGRGHLAHEQNVVAIRLLIPRKFQDDIALLSGTSVTNHQGQRIPLSELTRVEHEWADQPIMRKNGARVTYIAGETAKTSSLYSVLDLDRRLDGMHIANDQSLHTSNLGLAPEPPNSLLPVTLRWSGQIRQLLDAYRDLFRALSVAIALLFLVLVAYYQSFGLPAIGMLAIPFGLIGVFPGHWIFAQQFSSTSIVGIIALAGVVIRNSLLITDFVLEYRQQGRPLRDAVIDAGAIRLRPILLTALAIILGSAIMLTDPLFVGLAISLITGTLASTLLTVLLLPVMLYKVLTWREQRDAKSGI